MLNMRFASALALALGGTSPAFAGSVELSFFRVTSSGAPDIAGQIRLTVSDVSGQPGKVDLTVRNVVGTASSVTQVYFADGALLGSSTILQQGTVFIAGSGNLPGSASLDPYFTSTRSFRTGVGVMSDDSTAGNPAGLDRASDAVTFRFTLLSGATTQDVLNALGTATTPYGSLRVGVVAHSIAGSTRSDSFVNSPLIVPLPPAAWAGVVGLAAVAGAAWIRRRGHAEAQTA